MARPRKPARLHLRKARVERGKTRPAVWVVLDGGVEIGTGCGETDVEAATRFLNDYLTAKQAAAIGIPDASKRRRQPEDVPVAEVLAYYSLDIRDRYAEKPKQQKDFDYRIDTLVEWWGDKTVDDIHKHNCLAFAKTMSASTARRCLEDLKAAVLLFIEDRQMAEAVVRLTLPKPGRPRKAWYTRDQIARLVWTAYKMRRTYTYSSKRSRPENVGKTIVTTRRPGRHLVRFILFAVATGTRSERIERASFLKEEGRPWIDLENGLFHRSWDGEDVPANKRADVVRIPARMLAHCRRWHRQGARYLCEVDGKPVGTASAMHRLIREVLSEGELQGHNRHSFRHTCATWLMAAGEVEVKTIAGYLECSEQVVRKHYGKHHPDFQQDIDDAFTKGTAGRRVGSVKGRAARPAAA